MAYAPSTLVPRDLAVPARKVAIASAPVRSRNGLFSRFVAALMESRQRQADREIARYLSDTGGKFTDETEREIERRFLSTHW